MKIRYGKETDKMHIRSLWSYCFTDSDSFINYYFDHVYEPENSLVGKNQFGIQTSLQLTPYPVSINGHEIQVPYVVGVMSKPEARGKGYMKELLNKALKDMYEQERIYSILMPIDRQLYEPFGYHYIMDTRTYKVPIHKLRYANQDVDIEPLSREHLEPLVRFYEKQMSSKCFYVIRDEKHFRRLGLEMQADGGHVYVCVQDKEVTGYVFYYLEENTIEVREMLYSNRSSLEALLHFLGSHQTQVNQVKLAEAEGGQLKFILPHLQSEEMNASPFMMGRIIHLEKFLEAMSRPMGNKGRFALQIVDKQISENNKTIAIEYDETGLISQETKENPDISLDISDLSALFAGYLTYSQVVFLRDLSYNKEVDLFFNGICHNGNYIMEYV